MSETILVTGASGNLGSEVVRQLLEKGMQVRAGLRQPENAGTLAAKADPVRFDYHDPRTFSPALEGVARVFVVLPPLDPEAPQLFAPFLQAAKQAGVRHLVLTSAIGVDQDDSAPLRQAEMQLEASGLDYTLLRPNFFMENFSIGFIGPMINATGSIFLAAGEEQTSFISIVDIAAVAVAALTGSGHEGRAYTLTGPESLSHAEVAGLISEAGRLQVTYHSIDEETMRRNALENGVPGPSVDYLAGLYQHVRAGHVAGTTGDVRTVLDRAPVDFAAFARTNVPHWRA